MKTLIETLGKEGGYILDARAILQNDTNPENMRALIAAAHEFGGYDSHDLSPEPLRVTPDTAMAAQAFPATSGRAPGVCVPWSQHKAELAGPIQGSEELAERVWRAADADGAMFIWQMLLSF